MKSIGISTHGDILLTNETIPTSVLLKISGLPISSCETLTNYILNFFQVLFLESLRKILFSMFLTSVIILFLSIMIPHTCFSMLIYFVSNLSSQIACSMIGMDSFSKKIVPVNVFICTMLHPSNLAHSPVLISLRDKSIGVGTSLFKLELCSLKI